MLTRGTRCEKERIDIPDIESVGSWQSFRLLMCPRYLEGLDFSLHVRSTCVVQVVS